jgi:hypothetical protein
LVFRAFALAWRSWIPPERDINRQRDGIGSRLLAAIIAKPELEGAEGVRWDLSGVGQEWITET